MKTSPHMQFEHIRVKAQLEANEDVLLAIEKFSGMPAPVAPVAKKKPAKKKEDASAR